MFAPPDRVTAEIHAELPAELRIGPDRVSTWFSTQNPGRHADSFLEGPSFDRAGNLYLVDVAWGRILRLSAGGRFEVVADYEGAPNGLKIHRDGRIFVADYHRGVLVMDPTERRLEPVVERFEGRPLHGVNDLVFSEAGDLWFTDQGYSGLHDPYGRVFRLSRDGVVSCVLSGLPSPNGLVLAADGRTLFVNMTRDNAVWRVPLQPDGSVTKVGRFIRLSGGNGPDGLALDGDGRLAVAHLGLGAVWLFDALGEPVLRIDSPTGRAVTNLAFDPGGAHALYMTESETGAILVHRAMPSAGHAMYSHR